MAITPVGRVSYPSVFESTSFEGGAAKYEVTLIFEADADLSELEAMETAAIEKRWGNRPPKKIRSPIRDGNEKSDAAYAGKKFVRFSSKRKPQVVDKDRAPIEDDGFTFYPGCYARVACGAYCYDVSGNAGVSFGLDAVQKAGDGESLGGTGRLAQDVFDDGEEFDDAVDVFA